ncbi:hypothetical protein Taro_035534 [Colocasia esculenta]|uniref:AP2/ERF domain-containing protein n=1 Tax=Colocasia esculenta TaxID=4460 RepID=A0A843WF55_COLES|nr:hypothetical protein [Colocasia esculenta]
MSSGRSPSTSKSWILSSSSFSGGDSHGHGVPAPAARYKGARKRKWGSWVSEVRLPNSRERIWLGSHDTAEEAARAYDAAVFCLRGPGATFNFPHCLPRDIPVAPCGGRLTSEQIREVAARHAVGEAAAPFDETGRDLAAERAEEGSNHGVLDGGGGIFEQSPAEADPLAGFLSPAWMALYEEDESDYSSSSPMDTNSAGDGYCLWSFSSEDYGWLSTLG